MSMSNDFRQALERFVEERTLDIGNYLINSHQDYIQLLNQRLSIQKDWRACYQIAIKGWYLNLRRTIFYYKVSFSILLTYKDLRMYST